MWQLIQDGFIYYGFYFYLGIQVFAYFLIKRINCQGYKCSDVVAVLVYSLLSFISFVLISLFVSNVALKTLRIPDLRQFIFNSFICLIPPVISALLYFPVLSKFRSFQPIACSQILRENKYGIAIFFLLCFETIVNLPPELQGWSAWSYAVDYSMGMGSRFLIGSILSSIFPKYLPSVYAYAFCVVFCFILIAIVTFLLNKLIKNVDVKIRNAVLFLIACFLCSPGSVTAMFKESNLGRLDMYVLIVTLIAVTLFTAIKNIYSKYTVLSLACALSNAIYQGFMFLFFPLVLTTILFDLLNDSHIRIKNSICAMATTFTAGFSFLYFQFFKYVIYSDATVMTIALRKKTDLYINLRAINYEFFQPISHAYKELMLRSIRDLLSRDKLYLVLISLLPLIVIISYVFLKALHVASSAQLWKSSLFYSILSIFLCILPQFLLNEDWGRWLTAVTIDVFYVLFYAIYCKHQGINKAVSELTNYIHRHWFIAIVTIIYLLQMGKFPYSVVPENMQSIETLVTKIIGFVKK